MNDNPLQHLTPRLRWLVIFGDFKKLQQLSVDSEGAEHWDDVEEVSAFNPDGSARSPQGGAP